MEPAGEGISSSTILVSDLKAVKLFTRQVLAADQKGKLSSVLIQGVSLRRRHLFPDPGAHGVTPLQFLQVRDTTKS